MFCLSKKGKFACFNIKEKGKFACINIKENLRAPCACCQYKIIKLISILIYVEKINTMSV